jgi:hypothetical protein
MIRLDVEAFEKLNPYRTGAGSGSSKVTTVVTETELILGNFNENNRR